ncbi:MAG: ribosome small subunit-dependent GTPase A [Hyphomicrobium sp.]|nr:ribosome small subunit-dependent GTPase A [Hyphomicrobium sp.]PPD06178.1 MAG: ribosome small subunit-dependent GTPase A [Hyphomicrobium sp.]
MNLEHFGWSPLRGDAFAEYAADGFVPGRVVSEHRSHFQVVTTAGEVSAELSGRLRNEATLRSDLPAVGDFVALRPALADGPARIEALLPRTSALIRKASGEDRPQVLAANIDFVFIVTAPDGDFNPARLERLLALVGDSGAAPVVILNKADLADDVGIFTGQIAALANGVPVHVISARSREGLDAFEHYFSKNQTVGLIGSSGVGKSTLTNMLLGHDAQATQPVRLHDSRGRHTTTHRQLFQRAGGGCIIDTPGMRSVESWIRLDVDAREEASPRKPDRATRKPETKQKWRDRRRSEDAET